MKSPSKHAMHSSRVLGGIANRALLLLIFLILASFTCAQEDVTEGTGEAKNEETEPSRAVLFPWFAEALGIIVFFLTTRYVLILPYTAIMFILGTCMGAGGIRLGLDDQLTQSLMQWDGINYEVLLLIFLPGLVFNDAFGLDVHLFGIAIWQCLIYAYVLAEHRTRDVPMLYVLNRYCYPMRLSRLTLRASLLCLLHVSLSFLNINIFQIPNGPRRNMPNSSRRILHLSIRLEF